MEIIRRRRYIVILFLAIIMIMCSVFSSSALSKTIKCEFYKACPSSMSMSVGQSRPIQKVEKYTFNVNGVKTFESISSLASAFQGRELQPSSLKWLSSNSQVAKVSSLGKVTGLKKGTAYIYPVPKGVYSYKTKGRFITYTDSNLLCGLRIHGGLATKVTIKK